MNWKCPHCGGTTGTYFEWMDICKDCGEAVFEPTIKPNLIDQSEQTHELVCVCPHCGDKYDRKRFFRWECGTLQKFPSGTIRSELCHQTEVSNIWKKRADKTEAEVDRLREHLIRAIEMAETGIEWIPGDNTELESELAQIKATLHDEEEYQRRHQNLE